MSFDPKTVVEVEEEASKLKIEPEAALAVADVESGGVSLWKFDGKALPPIRFEGHYFYKLLGPDDRKRAVAQGLASPRPGAIKNPLAYKARYQLFERAKAINIKAAIESTSWGLGQVMGVHWKKLGYANVLEFRDEVNRSVAGQVKVMMQYIKEFGLIGVLNSHDWATFAFKYNGPMAAKNNYAAKLATAYRRYRQHIAGPAAPSPDSRLGDTQKQLAKLGFYKGPIDGIMGSGTRGAILKFQSSQGLVADGKIGPMTQAALDREIAKLGVSRGNKIAVTGMSVNAVSAAGDAVNTNVWSLQSLGIDSKFVTIAIVVMVVIGIGLTFFGLYLRTKHGEAAEQ